MVEITYVDHICAVCVTNTYNVKEFTNCLSSWSLHITSAEMLVECDKDDKEIHTIFRKYKPSNDPIKISWKYDE